MNLKDIFSPVLLIVLGIAFLAVSSWCLISKSKKTIRYKYKLGGMILSFSLFASCSSTEVTCYDPAIPDEIYPAMYNNTVRLTDSLFFNIYYPTYPYYSYQLTDSLSLEELNKGLLELDEEKQSFFVPVKTMPEDYDGKFIIRVYGEDIQEPSWQNPLGSFNFVLGKDGASQN